MKEETAPTDTMNIHTYLSFKLDEEVFAINVARVLEVLSLRPVTRVPNSPDFMRGVINLRGNVLPVIDTRLKFGLPSREDSISSCIIVLDIEIDDEEIMLGALVDGVQEVLEIAPEQVRNPPTLGLKYKTEFLTGMWKMEERFLMILNIDKIFSSEELIIVQEAGNNLISE